jgi:hypothetical protein
MLGMNLHESLSNARYSPSFFTLCASLLTSATFRQKLIFPLSHESPLLRRYSQSPHTIRRLGSGLASSRNSIFYHAIWIRSPDTTKHLFRWKQRPGFRGPDPQLLCGFSPVVNGARASFRRSRICAADFGRAALRPIRGLCRCVRDPRSRNPLQHTPQGLPS